MSADDPKAVRTSATPALAAASAADWPADVEPTAEYAAAVDFVRNEQGHLFITGRAGTGKSTLLKALSRLVVDEHIVLAPTGLAAVNVGGQTIHSFFGFPPRLIQSDDIRRSRNGALMRKLKLLVIDEDSANSHVPTPLAGCSVTGSTAGAAGSFADTTACAVGPACAVGSRS